MNVPVCIIKWVFLLSGNATAGLSWRRSLGFPLLEMMGHAEWGREIGHLQVLRRMETFQSHESAWHGWIRLQIGWTCCHQNTLSLLVVANVGSYLINMWQLTVREKPEYTNKAARRCIMLSTSDVKTYVLPAPLILSWMYFFDPMTLGYFHSCPQQDVDTFSPLSAWSFNNKLKLL